MPQRIPFTSESKKFKRKLFIDTGFGYVEVKARIIEPYTPPALQPKVKELEIVNAPSHISPMGFSSYKCTLTLLFESHTNYSDYLAVCGWTHKFYDERGAVYLGALTGIKTEAVQANNRYKVEVQLTLIKKDKYERPNRFEFQDVSGHWAEDDITEMANYGLISIITRDGYPVLNFRPNDTVTRAEFVAFLNRTRRFVEQALRR